MRRGLGHLITLVHADLSGWAPEPRSHALVLATGFWDAAVFAAAAAAVANGGLLAWEAYADDARRLETGTWAMACHYVGLAGLELILEVGVEHIQERLRDLTDRILQRCDEAAVKTFTPREREILEHVRTRRPSAGRGLGAAGQVHDGGAGRGRRAREST